MKLFILTLASLILIFTFGIVNVNQSFADQNCGAGITCTSTQTCVQPAGAGVGKGSCAANGTLNTGDVCSFKPGSTTFYGDAACISGSCSRSTGRCVELGSADKFCGAGIYCSTSESCVQPAGAGVGQGECVTNGSLGIDAVCVSKPGGTTFYRDAACGTGTCSRTTGKCVSLGSTDKFCGAGIYCSSSQSCVQPEGVGVGKGSCATHGSLTPGSICAFKPGGTTIYQDAVCDSGSCSRSSGRCLESTYNHCELTGPNEELYMCLPSCNSTYNSPQPKTTYFSCGSKGGTCCKKTGGSPLGPDNGAGSSTPTPTPPGNGYCGDSVPTYTTLQPQGTASCATSQTTATNNLLWQERKRPNDPSGYDDYCDWKYPQQRYFYICAPGTGGGSTSPSPTVTPVTTVTPTPFVPTAQGGLCNPVQGPWQCAVPNVCIVSGSQGRCCPAGTEWRDNTCKTPEATPTPTAATGPTATVTPVSTGSTCNDYIPASNIHQVCRANVDTCMGSEVLNSGGNDACKAFYNTDKALCCQLPQGAPPAGGSCNLPGRPCNPSANNMSGPNAGSNIACSGCGGFCVGTGTTGTCQNPY